VALATFLDPVRYAGKGDALDFDALPRRS
jgi:hypothetical protein